LLQVIFTDSALFYPIAMGLKPIAINDKIEVVKGGVAFGPCYTLIRLQALATKPVSASITNAKLQRAPPTHPVVASLDHPLFTCGGKRVWEGNIKQKRSSPSLRLAAERVDQRSVVGVSWRSAQK